MKKATHLFEKLLNKTWTMQNKTKIVNFTVLLDGCCLLQCCYRRWFFFAFACAIVYRSYFYAFIVYACFFFICYCIYLDIPLLNRNFSMSVFVTARARVQLHQHHRQRVFLFFVCVVCSFVLCILLFFCSVLLPLLLSGARFLYITHLH